MTRKQAQYVGDTLVRIVAFVLVFVAPCAARPRGTCSNRTLQGSYAFLVTGTNVMAGEQFALAGRFETDGNGSFRGAGTESVSGRVARISFTGTYHVEPECSGTAVFQFPNRSTSQLNLFVADDGDRVFIVVTDQGTVETGSADRQFREHHAKPPVKQQ